MASPALALSPSGARAAVVGLDTLLLVDLETLAVIPDADALARAGGEARRGLEQKRRLRRRR